MKFRRDAPLALIVAVVAVIASLTAASMVMVAGLTASVEQSEVQLVRAIVNFNLEGAATNALARAEITASDPVIREAMARRDRALVLDHTAAMFAEQRDKYGVDQMQFHIPPATSFLRLQAPTVFGDDLTAFRPMVVGVNRDFTARKGVAIAKTGPAIFGIAPIQSPNGDPVGSVEFGLDFGALLDRLKAAYGLELTLFLDEAPLRQYATSIAPGVLSEQNRVGSTIRYHSTNWGVMRELATAEDLRLHDDPSDWVREAGGVTYGVVLVPIRSGSGQVLGAVVAARSFEVTRSAQGRSTVIQSLLALFGVIALIGVVVIVVRGFLLRPLEAITARFASVGTGDPGPETDPDDAKLSEEMAALAEEHRRIAALNDRKPRT